MEYDRVDYIYIYLYTDLRVLYYFLLATDDILVCTYNVDDYPGAQGARGNEPSRRYFVAQCAVMSVTMARSSW